VSCVVIARRIIAADVLAPIHTNDFVTITTFPERLFIYHLLQSSKINIALNRIGYTSSLKNTMSSSPVGVCATLNRSVQSGLLNGGRVGRFRRGVKNGNS
jgi:hypothetical protein